MMKIKFWGDISFGLGVAPLAKSLGFDYFFSEVQLALKGADINVVNFDCTITDSEDKDPFRDGAHLKTSNEAAYALKRANIKLVALANNHIADFGYNGIKDTIAAFEHAGVLFGGISQSDEESLRPVIIEEGGIRVGIICCTDLNIRSKVLKGYVISKFMPDIIIKQMAENKGRVDHFIVSIHGGREFVNYPFADKVNSSRSLVDNGASCVIWHHSHVIGPVENYNGAVIAYGLGDFIFDQTDNALLPMRNYGYNVTLELGKNNIINTEIVPFKLDETFKPSLCDEQSKKMVMHKITEYGYNLGDLKKLEKQVYAQAGRNLLTRQLLSFKKCYEYGGIKGVFTKLTFFRPVHFKLFFHSLFRKVN